METDANDPSHTANANPATITLRNLKHYKVNIA